MLKVMVWDRFPKTRLDYNISANVGINQRNDPIDVELVQFGYWCMVRNPKIQLMKDEAEIYAAVVPGNRYSGTAAEALSKAIIRHQANLSSRTQDGHVSVMHGANYANTRGQKTGWLLSAINNNIFDVTRPVWPRIDMHPSCPPLLKACVANLYEN